MNAIMNETQLWYCDICDKTNNVESISKLINSETHIHKKQYGANVKEYEFNNPDIDEVDYILKDTYKDGRNKYFHSFENRWVYDIKFIIMEDYEENILTITIGCMKLKSHFYGLNKKITNALKKGFRFSKIVNLPIKYDSSLSNINIC